jgi:hypothetical protein
MGTPYAAAYPRPLYACAMGESGAGWLAIGAGEVPGAAMSLRIQAGAGFLEYLYREDLWGAADLRRRHWAEPLRLAAAGTAYEAYAALFKTLGAAPGERAAHAKSFFCTWGQFKKNEFDLRGMADFAAAKMPADVLIIDDPWESSMGSGEARGDVFADFGGDVEYARAKGVGVGLWMSLGWVREPHALGLTDDDLLLGADGRPRLCGWLPDPHIDASRLFYCLDPSSERARRFLAERSKSVMRRYRPSALKLDFGYGLPEPNAAAPRDASLRGERLCRALIEIVGQAAKEIDPGVTLMCYGVSPMLWGLYDMISMDDMGDCGDSAAYERHGHTQRCLWGALAAPYGMPVNASSGYYWDSFGDMLLDSFVLGANGAILPLEDASGRGMSGALACRWLAARKWRRRLTSIWEPLFLDADFGGKGSEPAMRSWARVETRGGARGICAAALRNPSRAMRRFGALPGILFTGKWALVSLGESGLERSEAIAAIPFAAGKLRVGEDGKAGFSAIECVRRDGTAQTQTLQTQTLQTDAPDENGAVCLAAGEAELETLVGFVLRRRKPRE